jgi:hypothetical protein
MIDQQFQSCVAACYDCADACDHCVVAVLEGSSPGKMVRCIRLNMDCAQLCRLAAACMVRKSEMVDAIWEVCAQICETCAEECARHAIEYSRLSMEACRHCAEECRLMIADSSETQIGRGQRQRGPRRSTH